jgi:hypothetical protein
MSNEKSYSEIAGKPGLRYHSEGYFFNRSTYAEDLLSRYPAEGAIGDVGFPVVRVSDGPVTTIPIFGMTDGRQVPTERSPGTEANAIGISASSVGVYLKSRSLAAWLPLEFEKADDGAWKLRESTVLQLRRGLVLDKDAHVGVAVSSASNVSSWFLPNSSWNAATNPGDAPRMIEYMITHIGSSGGLRPDTLIFGTGAWASFASNPAAVSRAGAYLTPTRAAEMFRVSTVAVSELRKNIGAGTDRRYEPVFPQDTVLACRVGVPGAFDARWACTPLWFPGMDKEKSRYLVEIHPLSRRNKATRIELTSWEAEVVVDPQLAAVLRGCNSAQSGGI